MGIVRGLVPPSDPCDPCPCNPPVPNVERGPEIASVGTGTTQVRVYRYQSVSAQITRSECLRLRLKSGGWLSLAWNLLAGEEHLDIAFREGWPPAGDGGVFSFLPVCNGATTPTNGRRDVRENGGVTFDSSGNPQAELSLIGRFDTTYFTVYDRSQGVYFEYYAGTGVSDTDKAFGLPLRRYDTKGNILSYTYQTRGDSTVILRKITGDIAGGIVPYFEYADDAAAIANMQIAKIYLLDPSSPSNSRTVYFAYGTSDLSNQYLTKLVNPNGCTSQYGRSFGLAQAYRLSREVDAEGYTTYFEYAAGAINYSLAKIIEPERRVTYLDYSVANETKYALQGRGDKFYLYEQSSALDQMPMITREVDPLRNTSYWTYDTTLKRCTIKVEPNGNRTYYQYLGGGSSNQYALTSGIPEASDGKKQYEYVPGQYDPSKEVGPRHTATFNATTYFQYDSSRSLTAKVDPLGRVTRYGRDSAGRLIRDQNPRGHTTYFNYDVNTGFLGSLVDALGGVAYFGYNSFGDMTRVVSPRWGDPGASIPDFTSYFEYDTLGRAIKVIDRMGNVTYHDWTSRGDPLALTNARGVTEAYAYDGLRLMIQRKITDNVGTLLTQHLHAYDIYKNRLRTRDGLGNTTYFVYDSLDRLTEAVDPLSYSRTFKYDSQGNLTASTDGRHNTTTFFYDILSRPIAVLDALSNYEYFFYDLADNRTHQIDARGSSTYFFYDELNRVQTIRDAAGNSTYFYFDEVGNGTAIRNARSNSTYLFYDGLNRKSAVRNTEGVVTYFHYDRKGNRTHIVNALQKATYFFYDRIDRVQATRDVLGNTSYYFYDVIGNLVIARDARANSMYFFYDGQSRTTCRLDALGNSCYFFYDAEGNLTADVSGKGTATYFNYDSARRRTTIKDALGNTTYFSYDSEGNLSTITNALNYRQDRFYDALNRPIGERDALGNAVAAFRYDAASNRTLLIRGPVGYGTQAYGTTSYGGVTSGSLSYFRYDSVNLLTGVRLPDGGSTYYSYNEVGSLIRVIDVRGNATYYQYDSLDQTKRMQDPLGRTLYFEYDALGRISRQVGAEGESATFTSDAVGRKTNVAYTPAGSVVSASIRPETYYVYDEVGNLKEVGDLWGIHRMGYDALNRITYHHYPYKETMYYEYDQSSNLIAIVYPSTGGRQTAYFDQLDRLQRVQATTGAHTTYYVYNAISNLTRMVYPNNQKLIVTYDDAGRTALWRYAKENGQTLSYFDYTRDSKGLITKLVREETHTVYYRYDSNDRLIAEIWSKSGTPEVYAYRYDYDLGGNRVRARINEIDTYYFYDGANQLTVKGTNAVYASPSYFIYDKNGSLTNLVEPSGATYYAYNAAGLVARIRWRDATATYFFYDGVFQRYAMLDNGTLTYFLWNKLNLLEERNAGGAVTSRHTHGRAPLAGIGQIVQTFRPSESASDQRIYPVMDQRGSITKWHKSDGTTILASREYDAFGQIIPNSSVGTWPHRFGYQGQAWLEIYSGNSAQRLVLSKYRLYDPTDGRFIQADLLRGNRLSKPYTYVNNDPLSQRDPLGLNETQEPSWWDRVKSYANLGATKVAHDLAQWGSQTGSPILSGAAGFGSGWLEGTQNLVVAGGNAVEGVIYVAANPFKSLNQAQSQFAEFITAANEQGFLPMIGQAAQGLATIASEDPAKFAAEATIFTASFGIPVKAPGGLIKAVEKTRLGARLLKPIPSLAILDVPLGSLPCYFKGGIQRNKLFGDMVKDARAKCTEPLRATEKRVNVDPNYAGKSDIVTERGGKAFEIEIKTGDISLDEFIRREIRRSQTYGPGGSIWEFYPNSLVAAHPSAPLLKALADKGISFQVFLSWPGQGFIIFGLVDLLAHLGAFDDCQ